MLPQLSMLDSEAGLFLISFSKLLVWSLRTARRQRIRQPFSAGGGSRPPCQVIMLSSLCAVHAPWAAPCQLVSWAQPPFKSQQWAR